MTKAIRPFLKHFHHLPWVCAAIILVAGLANWAMFMRHPQKPAPLPEPSARPGVFIDEQNFRQAVMPSYGEAPPFGTEEAEEWDFTRPPGKR